MPKIVDVKIDDHIVDVMKALGDKLPLALKAVGTEAVTYAQKECPVDSGRLRNSIAWAIKGETSGRKMPGEGEPSKPKQSPEENVLYIGSNVEYAAAQEYGDFAHKVGKKHFLRDSIATHQDHYKAIMEAALRS